MSTVLLIKKTMSYLYDIVFFIYLEFIFYKNQYLQKNDSVLRSGTLALRTHFFA